MLARKILPNIILWINLIHVLTFMLWPIEIRIVAYFFIIVGIIMFFFLISRKTIKINILPILLCLYYIYSILNSVFMYSNNEKFIYGIYQYVFYPSIMICSLYTLSGLNFSRIENFVCFISIITSIIAMFEFGFKEYIIVDKGYLLWNIGDENPVYRSMAFSDSPMTLGTMLGIYILTCIERYYITRKSIFIAIIFLNFLALFTTYSRGSLVASLGGVFFYFILMHKKINFKYFISKTFFVIIMIIIIMSINNDMFGNLFMRIETIFDWENDPSNWGRIVAWLESINIIFSSVYNFVFGIGLASTGALGIGKFTILVTESGVLKRFVEGGITMLMLYYIPVNMIIYKGIKIVRSLSNENEKIRIAYTVSSMITILIHDCVLQITESISISFFFWLFAARILIGSKTNWAKI